MKMQWRGVIPAITTPFKEDGSVDHAFLTAHSRKMIEAGCTGVVALGSLGESGTLEWDEKRAVLETVHEALGSKAPLISGISALSTREAVKLARTAEDVGCSGLMVLPPYVYAGDWREMKAHVAAICEATRLSCMLYNNPIAYKTDFLPEHIAELAVEHRNLEAVKESSADVRRIAALRSLVGDRLAIFCGVDDLIVEAIFAGATGWIAGLVNAFPAESVELFRLASAGDEAAAFEVYKWFLPLLRLDTVPKFIQLIKYVQQLADLGSERVRQPRLPLSEQEKSAVRVIFDKAMKAREQVGVGSRA
jgi:4-hydroxy-tetrahydrodipicolinate synthase